MIAKLQSPVVAIGLSLAVSVGVGVAASWGTLNKLILQAAKAIPAAPQVAPEAKAKGWDFWTIEIENLSNELKEERAKLKKQTEQMAQREARLVSEEKEFAKIRADVEAVRKQVNDRVLEISTDEAKNLRSLATTYASLTPRGAVAIMKEMDDTTVVKILALMKADVVGPIFEEMSKAAGSDNAMTKRAAQLSEKLRLMKPPKAGGSP
jgi:flagellar motility protein MotE (MotC chaperone)